jgi:5-methylcytosine-specific restriction endonuclease McrA
MKTLTRQDAIKQKSIRYYTGKPCKFGHTSERLVSTKRCLECDRLRSALRRENDPNYAEANRNHSRRFNIENNEYLKRIKRERYAEDKEFRESEKLRHKNYYRTQEGKQSKIISRNKYRALKINAQAVCINKSMTEEFYLNCPKGYEVDHIIPLSKGGNHDVSNLQYLTKTLNISKQDRHYTEIPLPIFCIPCNPVL